MLVLSYVREVGLAWLWSCPSLGKQVCISHLGLVGLWVFLLCLDVVTIPGCVAQWWLPTPEAENLRSSKVDLVSEKPLGTTTASPRCHH